MAGAIGPSLERIGEAEARAERSYRTGVEAQRAADATGIPRLSAVAEAAIGVVATAPDEKPEPKRGGRCKQTSVSRASCRPSAPP